MKTIDDVYQSMLDSFQQKAGFRPLDGDSISARLYAAAVQIQALYSQSMLILDNCFPQTAQGDWLNYHAQMFGLSRTEDETDEEFRTRIVEKASFGTAASNAAWYEQAAKNIPGVVAACAIPKARGTGTVDIYFTSEEGVPSTELLQTVSTKLQAKREILANLKVKMPTTTTINVSAEISAAGASESVLEAVRNAVREFFNPSLLGKPVVLADLGECIRKVNGVKSFKLLAPTSDLAADKTILPVLGTLTIV